MRKSIKITLGVIGGLIAVPILALVAVEGWIWASVARDGAIAKTWNHNVAYAGRATVSLYKVSESTDTAVYQAAESKFETSLLKLKGTARPSDETQEQVDAQKQMVELLGRCGQAIQEQRSHLADNQPTDSSSECKDLEDVDWDSIERGTATSDAQH